MNDDELLARLRAADPALTADAPPPDIDCLVAGALNGDGSAERHGATAGIPTHPTKAAPARGRGHRFALAAAVALILAGGGIAGGMRTHDDTHPPTAQPLALALTMAPGSASAKCREPVPDLLRPYPTLFEGTVTSVKGSSVSFRVDQWFRGGGAESVRLDGGAGRPERLTFSVGGHYIVAATKDGVVPVCGANMASADTRKEFRQAFGIEK
ncbi:hypothetical protein ACFZDK_35385 [Streptomyces sp. NPDC007901]|uniref:hypothetical protein n=1 Tax=Streptomyces sp. NPDC007901 TaxID=3364785 RepID=UPI0036E902AC